MPFSVLFGPAVARRIPVAGFRAVDLKELSTSDSTVSVLPTWPRNSILSTWRAGLMAFALLKRLFTNCGASLQWIFPGGPQFYTEAAGYRNISQPTWNK